ncbi:MAG TPA: HAMP domain-containing sensor histidine kinase [Candidatus Elarobacter sp.]|jgi:two-component system OmpR family sensor kinase|nr:HAMP domain-containing sensor histidine kinase [Candidatus Elarobacter sp.]
MIRSLRSQLIFANVSLGIAVMVIFIAAMTALVGTQERAALGRSIPEAVADARRVVATAPRDERVNSITRRIVERERSKGVLILSVPRDEMNMLQPGPIPFPGLGGLFGFRSEPIMIRRTMVIIVPSPERINTVVRNYLIAIAVAIAASLLVSVLIARWSSARAVSPLLMVTEELRRVGRGDFTRRVVAANERGEIGELALAFNEAAKQVSASFEERRRVEEQMRRFVADAGHELKTPLTIVRGFVDLLRRGGIDNTGQRDDAFRQLTSQVSRMGLLIERLIKLAELDRLPMAHPELVNVPDVVRDAAVAVRLAHGAEIAYEGEARAVVLADPADVYEAVANILENAAKYGGGTAIVASVSRTDEQVIVRVRDGGPGIFASDAERVFERFYRGESAVTTAGSGLGLSIAAAAAQRAGGAVVLEDPHPGRTTFTVVLPVR